MVCARAFAMLAAAPWVAALETSENPLGKVIQLMDDLSAKVVADGEAAAKAYGEYKEWCDEASHNAMFAIEDATAQKAKLEAQVTEFKSDASVATSRIEKLSEAIATAEKDLQNATTLREGEVKIFKASEAELMDTVDALSRAIGVLEKEMAKKPAALAQLDTKNIDATVQALSAILEAASFPADDRDRLQAMLQMSEDADEPGAPKAANYESKSGGIVDVLEDLKEKAEGELSDLRKAETTAKQNYKLLSGSLKRQLGQDKKSMADEKSAKAQAEEGKATAEGELSTTTKLLANSKEELASTQSACISTAADYEATLAGREEELKDIAVAKKVLVESTGGAESKTYALVQLGESVEASGGADVVAFVKRLAKKHHSAALAQLASQVAAVAKFSGREDPFAKIKDLIRDMIQKLQGEAEAEAQEKKYCDEQLSKTKEKKGELEDDIAKMTADIDSAVSKSAQLKDEVKVLQQELAALSKEQAEMDKIRQETHEDYVATKKDLELGLSGVRKALTVLRDYYGGGGSEDMETAMLQQPAPPVKHSKAGGAGSSIIGLLEVVESDFAKNLAKVENEEADAESEYQKVTQENKVTQASKQQVEKYKTQESKSLDKSVAEISGDREKSSTELAAVDEYYAKIKERCIAKPETYHERAARRAAEIEGLKEALRVLREEAAFVQRSHHRAGRRHHSFLAAH